MISLEQALNTVEQLSLEQQEMLLEILQNRLLDIRRQEIARDAKESINAFHQGEFKPQPLEIILRELRETLE
ncbi:hypothetical protein MiAbW_03016 [Microcystis aeruginosa NIES-4325]|jgi:dsRNA-specific ribonuclease|uniref:HigA protein (Antitoxin to HigB) n=1 Tax=Microcystis aeruginosa NIES-4325 TaxID=2569534 RepID=A0A5J4FB96_MICAE|nr:hypothetical protein [Microcystis aeruginosa]NCQ92871.1 hypothetical protein [Microcystis aeruginosa LG13-13]NCR05981.1 hypothetical protein [Microcystis aeruginosa LG13-03]NCR64248.1 hypothetical protein [Microcystis aeruginosa LG11-05]GEA28441.1 hypothetical protein MiAbW_03016 [Microcystis aeruginosa NIES-4325]